MTQTGRPCSILLVEDSPEDREATTRAFKRAGLDSPIHYCVDGDDALDWLFRRGKYTDPGSLPQPSVILLDLNLPGTDGREVLAEIKKDEQLKTIPILILTTSADERDVERCYRMGANSYLKKPVGLEEFYRTIQVVKDFWLDLVVLPKSDGMAHG